MFNRSTRLRVVSSLGFLSFVFVLAGLATPDPVGPFPLAHAGAPATLEFPFVPDPTMTVGSLCSPKEPDYSERRYPEQIAYCKRTVSSQLKREIYEAYGVPPHCRSEYTIDHFIPLSIGGTNRRENLWPEHKDVKNLRKNLELDLFEDVRDGKLTQSEAVRRIREAKLSPPIGDPSRYVICH